MSGVAHEIRVLAAGPQDAARIAEIHARLFEEPWDRQSIAGLLDRPVALALIATPTERRTVAGFIIASIAADEAEVLSLGVAPEFRRRGVARLLVQELASAAAEKGARQLYIDVGADNGPAVALYRGLGFTERGRRDGYYAHRSAPASNALLMARPL